MNQLPNRIRMMRKSCGLTQSQLAKLIGVAQPYINEIERGKKMPSIGVLERLCDSLGSSADYLLDIAPRGRCGGGEAGCGLSPELLSEISSSGITDEEMRFALKVALLRREGTQES